NRPRLAVQSHREPPQRAVIRVFEGQRKLLFDVAARAGTSAAAARRAARLARAETGAATAAEKRLKEIGERTSVAQHLPPFLFGHRAVAAACRLAAVADVPSALLTAETGTGRHVLVRTPVRAELVVLLALVRIAEHFVRFVDFLELPLGGLVARIDVRVIFAR